MIIFSLRIFFNLCIIRLNTFSQKYTKRIKVIIIIIIFYRPSVVVLYLCVMSVTCRFLELSVRAKTHSMEDFFKVGFTRSFSIFLSFISPFVLMVVIFLCRSRWPNGFNLLFTILLIIVSFSLTLSDTASFVLLFSLFQSFSSSSISLSHKPTIMIVVIMLM